MVARWLSQIFFRSYVFGPLGFWTMAPLHYAAEFDPFTLHPGTIQGEEGIKFYHLATLGGTMWLRVRRHRCK